MLERPILVLDCTIFGAGSSGFGAGNLVLERAFLVLDRGLSMAYVATQLILTNLLYTTFWMSNNLPLK